MFQERSIIIVPEIIVNFEENSPVFKPDVLKELIVNSDSEFRDVFVICITGTFRSGKSFLISLLETYFTFYAKVSHHLLNVLQ